jgi:malate synthase
MNMIEILKSHKNSVDQENLFPPELRNLMERLHFEFDGDREQILSHRRDRHLAFDFGIKPRFEYKHIAKLFDWKVATIPQDLQDRRVEVSAPAADLTRVDEILNSKAQIARIDFDQAQTVEWESFVLGLENVKSLVNRKRESGQRLQNPHPSFKIRNLHSQELNVKINGQGISAGLFDLACLCFHTAQKFLDRDMTSHFYVPQTEHYLEARWWNKVMNRIEKELGLTPNRIRVTFGIETIFAAFQMEEILYEIRDRACGFSAGKWDQIFSKSFFGADKLNPRNYFDIIDPSRKNFARLLVRSCHKHGAFALNGACESNNKLQIEKEINDKSHDFQLGFDGGFVSQLGIVEAAFNQYLRKNQLDFVPSDLPIEPQLIPTMSPPFLVEQSLGCHTELSI